MQEGEMHIAKQRLRFLDPFVNAEDRHKHPLQWEDNHDTLVGCTTAMARQKKCKEGHINAMKRIPSYIAHMMFKWQDRDFIWAPYHLGLV